MLLALSLLCLALLCLVVALLVVLLRRPTLTADLLEQQHLGMLEHLHGGLNQQSERLLRAQADADERLQRAFTQQGEVLREAISRELQATRQQMQALALQLQEKQDQLRTELITRTLQMLSEQSRLQQEAQQQTLQQVSAALAASVTALTQTVEQRLETISGKVGERLDEGFKKTNETFVSVMERLATIDEAQKKIDSLTGNVVSLQELLGDKRSRGAFGEVQLEALIRNLLPTQAFDLQASLPNGTRVDCLLHLPAPTGELAIDAKFPLENYQRLTDRNLPDSEQRAAQVAFKADVKKHIGDIAAKYIIPGVTAEGAVMFIPAEAVFAEIHAWHPDLVQLAQEKRVWIVSPTTLMAVLTTARAVMRDVETRKEVHVIQEALRKLADEFKRFDVRMKKLADHIRLAHEDAQQVQTTSDKISRQFGRIEKVQLDGDDDDSVPLLEAE